MLKTPLRAAFFLVLCLIILAGDILALVVATTKVQIIISVLFVLLMAFFTGLAICKLLDFNDDVKRYKLSR